MRIKQFGDPILRQKSILVEKNDLGSDKLIQTIARIKTILNGIKAISNENGNALSAPQIGVLVRLVVLRLQGEFVVMLNPEIIDASPSQFQFTEECFSFYNLRAQVTRAKTVTVGFIDPNGQAHSLQLSGEEAGLIQHEIDHLNGVIFLDRVDKKESIASIDYLFQHSPAQLKKVKQMIDYMAGCE